MTPETRNSIKGYLEGFMEALATDFSTENLDPRELRPPTDYSADGKRKPFHEALIPHGLISIAEFERCFTAKLGTAHEECARRIAEEKFTEVERSHRIKGLMSEGSSSRIQRILEGASAGYLTGRFSSAVADVLAASDDDTREDSVIADLYCLDAGGTEHYFELKSPKPNKGQCIEATRRFLTIHALRGAEGRSVKTFYGMPYNPYGSNREDYAHSIALNYLDMQQEVLLESELWEYLGGSGTYDELIHIYREVGREKGPDVLDKLALGY